jgi:hypothetical protein
MVFLAVAASTAASAKSKQKDYIEPDGGYVIYSVGTAKIGMDFSFFYNRIATMDGQLVEDWKGVIEPKLGGAFVLKIKNPDFTGLESGHVIVRRLPPGSYNVDSFFFGGFVPGVGGYSWSSAKPFSLPFTIRSGEATYIGSFMRAPSLGTPLESQLGAAGFFVIADRSERDLPIAKTKLPQPATIVAEVTDVSLFGSAALRTAHP